MTLFSIIQLIGKDKIASNYEERYVELRKLMIYALFGLGVVISGSCLYTQMVNPTPYPLGWALAISIPPFATIIALHSYSDSFQEPK